MRLAKLKLKNFRCYKELTSIIVNDLTCILGKNDVGKSTILEALDGFFNETIDKGDLNADLENGTIEISCIFDETPKKLVLDSAVETNPIEENILNSSGNLEIKKVFIIGKSISKSTYLIASHPTHEKLKNILSLKNTPLKNLAEEIGANLEGVNKTKNPPLRKAIRDAIESEKDQIEIKIEEAYADNEIIVEIPEFEDEDDVPELVAKILYESTPEKDWNELEESQQKRKESKVKKFLNTQAVSKMTIERLETNNAKDEIELWLKTLEEIN